MFHRLVLLLSLLGMVLSLHLWIQKERNFAQGCWGMTSAAAAPATGGCNDEALKKYNVFLGVSVAAWGYAFYFLVAALALGKILLPAAWARGCHTASEMAVALAFPFSLYLVWVQGFVAKAFCPLCLVSTGLVTGLFIIHAVQYRRGGFAPIAEPDRMKETGYAAGMGFVALGLLAGLMIIVNQVGTRRLDQGENVPQFEAMLGRALPKQIDPKRLMEMKPLLYNPDLPPLDLKEWTSTGLPPLGENPALPVVVFIDPNCPSCKMTYTLIKVLARDHGKRAQFHVISRSLWPYSELQSQALELAAQSGKYHEMWQLQFDHAKQGGLGLNELEALFAELGLETRDLAKRLAAVRPAVIARKDRAIVANIHGTPTLFINGRAVAAGNTDLVSLVRLIDQAAGVASAGK